MDCSWESSKQCWKVWSGLLEPPRSCPERCYSYFTERRLYDPTGSYTLQLVTLFNQLWIPVWIQSTAWKTANPLMSELVFSPMEVCVVHSMQNKPPTRLKMPEYFDECSAFPSFGFAHISSCAVDNFVILTGYQFYSTVKQFCLFTHTCIIQNPGCAHA